MAIIITGLDQIVNLINTNFTIGQLGTATDIEARDDEGLISVVAATQGTLTASTAKKFLQKTYTIAPTTGNGITYSEFSIVSSTAASGTSFNRVTFNPKVKTIGETWTITDRFFIRERNR